MSNFEEVKYPPTPNYETHFLNKESVYLDVSREELLLSSSFSVNTTNKAPQNTKVTIIEEGLGVNALWNYVKYNNKSVYFLRENLTPLNGIKQSMPLAIDSAYQQNLQSPKIDWREQKPNTVYLDTYNAKFCTHIELPYEKVNGKEDLKEKIKEGYYKGVALILKETAKQYDIVYINQLTDSYYKFAEAEEYFFPLRECSTLRVLVTISSKYLNSGFINNNKVNKKGIYEEKELLDLFNSQLFDEDTFGSSEGSGPTSDQDQISIYETLEYNNYDLFSRHISEIKNILIQNQVIYATGQWDIVPDGVNLNFLTEIANIELFFNKINKFLDSNISKKPIDQAFNINNLVSSIVGEPWSGNLKFILNKNDTKIVDIQFFDNFNNKIPLNIGYYSILQDETILNKTTINYLKKIKKPTTLDDILLGISGSIMPSLQSAASSLTLAVTNPEQALKNLAADIQNAPENIANNLANAADNVSSGIDNAAQNIQQLIPDEILKKFLINYHEPSITDIIRRPIDLAQCVQSNYNLLKEIENNIKPAALRQFESQIQEYQKRKKEFDGSTFDKILSGDISKTFDPRLRKLFGLDPIDFSNPIRGLNEILGIINLFDIQRWLLESLKCGTLDFDPQQFNKLLEQYGNVKKALDALAVISVCNPNFTNVLKLYTSFTLPLLPTTNPNRSLIEQLIKLVVQVTNDIVVLTIRQLLTNSFKNCADDKRRNNLPNSLSNNIDPNAGFNGAAIDDLLNDISGGIYDENGEIIPEARDAAKQKLKQLLDELSNCLSTRELCALLTGKTVNDSVIDAIVSFIKRKYNNPNGITNLANKFNNRDYIINFFLVLGRNLGDDLLICDDILNQPEDFNKNPLCDDGTINNLRKKLLGDKGLTPDLIDDLLKDINDKKAKNLDDLLKFLDSDDPFKYDNIPSVLCKDGIPPAIKVSPSIDSFKGLLNALFRDVYDNFDRESTEWYKTTYSTKGGPKTMSFDESGKLVFDTSSAGEATDSDKSGLQEIIPNFLFDQSITTVTNNSLYDDKSYSYKVFLNGKAQRDLDVTILESSIKTDIETAEKSLRDFLSDFNIAYNLYITTLGIQIGFEVGTAIQSNNFQRASSNSGVLQTLEANIKGLSPTFFNEFLKFIRLQDMFMVNSISDIDELKVLFPDNKLLANHLVISDSGIAVYITVCEYLIKHKNDLSNMLNQIAQRLRPASENTLIPNENVASYNDLLQQLEFAISQYNQIKNAYELLLNSSINYPSYDLNMSFGLSSYSGIKNYDNESIYNISSTLIKKNNKQYIKFGSKNKVKDSIKNYILNDLKIDKDGINKNNIFNEYIKSKNDLYNSYIDINSDIVFDNNKFSSLDKFIFNKLVNNIKSPNNLFDNCRIIKQEFKPTPDSEVEIKEHKVPYTKLFGDKLVIKQTPEQKACNVRPHYLDIDSIKSDIINNKEKSLCSIEEAKNENIINNIPINSSEMQNLETSETQNIILNGVFKLAIRTYLHDILLRGINLFSYYDPQSLRKDESFISFMAYLVESEMRGVDNTFFTLMMSGINRAVNPDSSRTQQEIDFLSRDMFKDTVAVELQEVVLPKLAKRLNEDTNKYLIQSQYASLLEPLLTSDSNKTLKLVNVVKDAKDLFAENILFQKQDGVYLLVDNNKAIKISDGTYEQFANSVDYELLFEYLFPQTQYLSFMFITSALSTSTRRSILDIFKDTKACIRNLGKIAQTNGANITPDLTNAQDIINNDTDDLLKKYLFETLLKTPFLIFKGFAEMSEPNLLISSSIYKTLSLFVPETPSFIIPPTSGILFATGISFVNPIVYFLYLGGFFWYEDKSNNSDIAKKSMLLKFAEGSGEDMNCESITNNNNDLVKLNNEGIYEI